MNAHDTFPNEFDPKKHELTIGIAAPIELVLNDESHESLVDIRPWGKRGDLYRCCVLFEAAMLVRDTEALFTCEKWMNAKRRSKKMFETIKATEARIVEKTRGAMVSLAGLPEVTNHLGRAWCWTSDDAIRFAFEPQETP
jgi:hypothetical protein